MKEGVKGRGEDRGRGERGVKEGVEGRGGRKGDETAYQCVPFLVVDTLSRRGRIRHFT